jgi:hypothetical protein
MPYLRFDDSAEKSDIYNFQMFLECGRRSLSSLFITFKILICQKKTQINRPTGPHIDKYTQGETG